jgi:hypothetical protein
VLLFATGLSAATLTATACTTICTILSRVVRATQRTSTADYASAPNSGPSS